MAEDSKEVAELKKQLEAAEAAREKAELKAEKAEADLKDAKAAVGKVPAPKERKVELTDTNSHVATSRGYAGGMVIEEGQFVPAGVAVALDDDEELAPNGWMRKAKKADLKEAEEA